MKILVLGANGMLGNAMLRVLSERSEWQVYGTLRAESSKLLFPKHIAKNILTGVDVGDDDSLLKVLIQVRADVVINCIGLVKQLSGAEDPLQAIPINTLLPHRISRLCELSGARLIHMSTDCVFSGEKGNYIESDLADPRDIYGMSKLLGEVAYPHTLTLRTSIIGHELRSAHGLVEWFLSQDGCCKGFTRAIFSGLPTVVLSRIIRDVVIPRSDLFGVYHVAAEPISKFALLKLIAEIYGKVIDVIPDDGLAIDRSLNASRFVEATGFVMPRWPELVRSMHSFS